MFLSADSRFFVVTLNKLNTLALWVILFGGFVATAFGGQCTFTVNPSGQAYTDSLGYLDTGNDPLVIQVTASSQTCDWTADASDGFATVSGSAARTGNGSVTYSVAANTTGVARSVVLNIAGNAVTLTEKATPSTFADEPLNDSFFDGINLMRTNNITKGCLTVPLNYCPNANVTRDQMAVFIVRTILGGGPNVDNFQYSSTPYFTDVPPTYQYFKWIQKMRELGITSGTTATTYGPQLPVTRGQMAVFIVRARLGTSTVFTYNPTPYFIDVPANYQFFKWVQKLKEIGITSGTTATTYSPDETVTRGQMAVFLIRAGFNTLLNPVLPLITSAAPNNGAPGTSVSVAVTGINTHFASDTTILADDGVTGSKPVVTDATHLTVTLTIPTGTTPGQISITAETLSANEEATLPNGFTIGTGDPVPTVTSFTPASGPIGTSVTLTGNTLVSSLGTPVSVLVPLQGGGLTGAPVESASANSITFVMPSTAASGIITLSSASGTATSATPFTVVPSSTYTIGAAPSTANVIAGQTATYTITSSTSTGFTGLSQLSVSGLPSGVTAAFSPAQISVGEQSILTITAPASQTTNTANLVISAAAIVDGLAVPAATNVTLNVTPVSTSFIARAVVDNGTNTSLVGVVVTMLGQDGSGNATACTGSTTSDGSGNIALTNLSAVCLGPQLIGFDGNHVTSPSGIYAGLQLVFTLVVNQVVVSPVLVHLPRIDNVETFLVKQNATVDQSYTYKSIPGLSLIVYAGTVFTEQNGTQPDPFPMAAIEVPVDRLPDVMPVTSASVTAFIVAFQPAETNASQPAAVWFPNTQNVPPGTTMPLMSLDPTKGRMVPYGNGTVSNDGTTIIPDVDPSTGSQQHRFGILHFDWDGPQAPPPPKPKKTPDPEGPSSGEPVDLSSGIEEMVSTDLTLTGGRGGINITRTYVTLDAQSHMFGVGSTFNYDYNLDSSQPQSAAMINLLMPDGVQIPFSRISDGTLVNQTIPSMAGSVMTTAADGSTILREKSGTTYTFMPGNGAGSFMTSIGDPNGNITMIVHDASYRIVEIDDPVGRKLVLTNDDNGRITSVTDPIGRKVSYTYNGAGCLDTFTNAGAGVTRYEYDPQNRLSKITDASGVVQAQYVYDVNGRVIRQTTSAGGSYQYAYTPINSLVPTSPILQTVETDPNGNSTTYRFNADGFVVGVTDPLGQTRTFDRQSGTNFVTGVHGAGRCQVCGDTTAGDFTFTFDASGNLTSETDSLGATAHYTYDPVFNRLLSLTDPLGNTSSFAYDARGNLTTLTDARNHVITLSTNSYGLITAIRNSSGQTETFTWDSQANLVKTTDPAGLISTWVYDAVSRLVGSIDSEGNQASVAWNLQDEMVSSTDENGNKTTLAYDTGGRPVSYTDPKGGTIAVSYDAAGRIVSRTDQQSAVSTRAYDLKGNVVSATKRGGQQGTFTYDALDRVIAGTYSDGAQVKAFYDASGRLARVTDSVSGSFEYAYDSVGRATKSTGPFGAVNYGFNASGLVTSRQVVGQPEVDYTYDAAQNLVSASTAGASIAVTYDGNDQVQSVSRSNGVNGQYGFDTNGRLISINERSGVSGGTTVLSRTMTFDALGQLASQSVEAGQPLSLQATSSGFNGLNQLTAGAGSVFTYDANGNRTSEVSAAGTTSYTWDDRGRLQTISAPGGVVTAFQYDYDGNLIEKRVTKAGSDVIERYVLDDMTNVAEQELVGSGTVNFLNGRAPDSQFATISGGSVAFGIVDYNGSVAAVTDSSGAVASRIYYSPYGQTTATGAAYPVEFTNRQQVAQDLYYFRARFLDARNGNFLSEDPEGIAGGDTNLYRYGNGDPIGFVDPSGTAGFPAAVVLAGPVGFLASLAGTAVTNHQLGKPWLHSLDSDKYNPWLDAGIAAGTGIVTAAIGSKLGVASKGGLFLLGAGGNVAQTVLQNVHHNLTDHGLKGLACDPSSGVVQAVVTGGIGGVAGGPVVATGFGAAFASGLGKIAFVAAGKAALGVVKGFATNLFGDIDFTSFIPPPTVHTDNEGYFGYHSPISPQRRSGSF